MINVLAGIRPYLVPQFTKNLVKRIDFPQLAEVRLVATTEKDLETIEEPLHALALNVQGTPRLPRNSDTLTFADQRWYVILWRMSWHGNGRSDWC